MCMYEDSFQESTDYLPISNIFIIKNREAAANKKVPMFFTILTGYFWRILTQPCYPLHLDTNGS